MDRVPSAAVRRDMKKAVAKLSDRGAAPSPPDWADAAVEARRMMAKAIASKAFPASGDYEIAGWSPAGGPDRKVLEFLDAHGRVRRQVALAELAARDRVGRRVDVDGTGQPEVLHQ